MDDTHPHSMAVRLAMEAAGGGSSGRLFTEIREKRGLAYSVWAGYSGIKDHGSITAYAATSVERAQDTLDRLLEELDRLRRGLDPDELRRVKTRSKSTFVMAEQTTSGRAGGIAQDLFIRGQIRSTRQVLAEIDAVSIDQVNALLAEMTMSPLTAVTVGPGPLRWRDLGPAIELTVGKEAVRE